MEELSHFEERKRFEELHQKYKVKFQNLPVITLSYYKNLNRYIKMRVYQNLKLDVYLVGKDTHDNLCYAREFEISRIIFLRKRNIIRINEKIEEQLLLNS